ncbi:MAG TPA: hypothetical protein VFN76_00535 [Candidatus Limnocylindria bacterium]|nr:hypothetical protein [Candidatus Limnocylindria bacterium]
MHAHPRIAFARRLLLAAILASTAMTPQAALADHGGRDITAQFNCNRPVTPPRCTSVGDNPRHLVYFDPSLTDELAASMRRTLADDYGPTKLVVIEQSRLTRMTDVIVFSGDYGENGAAGWVYCPSDAPQGTNPSGDRWCRQQELHLNLNARYGAYFDDDASRDYVTCHEMGHTIGLRHWGNPPQTSGSDVGATCMNANTPNGPTGLHQFDVDHINAYHYRRDQWPGRRILAAPSEPRPRQQLLPWAGRLDALEVDAPTSLGELVTTSDAVVRGRVVAVSAGRTFGGLHYATATLQVHDVLAGAAGSSLALEIPLFDGPESIGSLPDWGESVFFLRNKGTSARIAGESVYRQREEARFYRLLSFDSLVVNDGGHALADPESPPLARLSGERFDDVVEAVAGAAHAAVGGR